MTDYEIMTEKIHSYCDEVVFTRGKALSGSNMGMECIMRSEDGSFELYLALRIGEWRRCRIGEEKYRLKLAFLWEQFPALPAVFRSERVLEESNLKLGVSPAKWGAMVCGKIVDREKIGDLHLFRLLCGKRTFSVVFSKGVPCAEVGEILYGNFRVLTRCPEIVPTVML